MFCHQAEGWWRCCAMYDTTRSSGAECIHLHLLPIALFSNHVPCGLFPFMCFEWWCLWNWTYARYYFNQWMRLEKHHQFIHTPNSSVHISYTGFKSNCSSLLYVLLLRNVQQHSQASLLIHERPAFAFLLSVSAPFPPVRRVTEPRCCRGRRPCSHASPPWSLESIGLQGTRVFHEDLMDTIIDHWKMIGYD